MTCRTSLNASTAPTKLAAARWVAPAWACRLRAGSWKSTGGQFTSRASRAKAPSSESSYRSQKRNSSPPALAPPASTRRLDAQDVARARHKICLRSNRQELARAQQRVASRPSCASAPEPVGPARTPVGKNGHVAGREKFDLAHDSVAAGVLSRAARAASYFVAMNA